ncbi:antibiotic biosynthesis monooxygenase [Actinocorallia sp. A-T 12471]|uniref:antibiotic biosynthesis monooxygenase family protein n=1 Tax=Actinocorallia sp. A-T 12471 TaxID=3089813 RepID=UPI0029D2A532|nr:antibiotic biosynthesis monooxygenase [Actinocorallia sp. A-T 12471]MDX6744674.1 antibiotic biosynthesis monooxygenase [Actinocorallia sp. A-T 12471]
MIAITRYRVPDDADFTARMAPVLDALAACPGYVGGDLGRCVDDPELWALVTRWEGAGYYRRALGAVRMAFIPLSALAVDEPGAYEVIKTG